MGTRLRTSTLPPLNLRIAPLGKKGSQRCCLDCCGEPRSTGQPLRDERSKLVVTGADAKVTRGIATVLNDFDASHKFKNCSARQELGKGVSAIGWTAWLDYKRRTYSRIIWDRQIRLPMNPVN